MGPMPVRVDGFSGAIMVKLMSFNLYWLSVFANARSMFAFWIDPGGNEFRKGSNFSNFH